MKKIHTLILYTICLGTMLCPPVSCKAFASSSQISPGIYELSSPSSDSLVLDIRTCTRKANENHTLQLYTSLDVNQQKFYLESLSGSYFRITTPATGEALTAEKSDAPADSEDTPFILSMQPLTYPNSQRTDVSQTWRLKDAEDGYFYIYSMAGKYLTVDTVCAWEGSPVTLKDYDGSIRQKWKLTKTNFSAEDQADTDLLNPYGPSGEYSGLKIVLDFGNLSRILSAADFSEWMTETIDHQLTLDKESLISYVNDLAEIYDTAGETLSFTTSSGNEIIVPSEHFGWKLDVENTASSILQSSQSRGSTTLEPVWLGRGSGFPGHNGIGNSYVEVDLTNQKVWLYKDGQLLLETNCVTGTYQTDRQTPEGVYSIYYRQSPAVLNGPGYSSPVEYWMAFYQGYGLHDANWRDSFGGEIYLTNGSHGCVNLPTEAARQIYEIAEIGYPVVCYN